MVRDTGGKRGSDVRNTRRSFRMMSLQRSFVRPLCSMNRLHWIVPFQGIFKGSPSRPRSINSAMISVSRFYLPGALSCASLLGSPLTRSLPPMRDWWMMLLPRALLIELPHWHIRVTGGLYILSDLGGPSSSGLLLHPVQEDFFLDLVSLCHFQYLQRVRVRITHSVYLSTR